MEITIRAGGRREDLASTLTPAVKVYLLSSWRALRASCLALRPEMVAWKKRMDKGSAEHNYDKEFLFSLIVVVFTIGSATFLSAVWLTLIGYGAWVLFNWIAA